MSDVSRERLEKAIESSPFSRWVGVTIARYEAGSIEIDLPLRDVLTQHHGFAHGAIVGYMADTACAWAAASVAGDVVTAEYKINFLAPAVGERLTATGRVIKLTTRSAIAQADVVVHAAGETKLVAVALATIARLDPRP